jgi:prevent-host-death family protein
MKVNVYEAKTRLSQLLDRALAGEEVIVARHGKPLVRLVPIAEESGERMFGRFRDQFEIPEDFDSDPEIERLFNKGALEPRSKSSRRRRRA